MSTATCELCDTASLGGGRWCYPHWRSEVQPTGAARGAACGTDAGYARHRRSGNDACRACKDAHNQARKRRDAA